MSQNVQDPTQNSEEDMGEAFGPLPVGKLEVCSLSQVAHRWELALLTPFVFLDTLPRL